MARGNPARQSVTFAIVSISGFSPGLGVSLVDGAKPQMWTEVTRPERSCPELTAVRAAEQQTLNYVILDIEHRAATTGQTDRVAKG